MSDDELTGQPDRSVGASGDFGGRRTRYDPSDVTRRWLARTTFAVGVALALFAVFAIVVTRPNDDVAVIGAARLTWNPETDDALGEGKAASVEIIEEDGRYRAFIFDIEVLRPPADFEFIEAWLVDDTGATERLSVGTFDEIRTRVFPLPPDVDPRTFDFVEFSLQPRDGDGAYSGRTLIRGEMVWLAPPPD